MRQEAVKAVAAAMKDKANAEVGKFSALNQPAALFSVSSYSVSGSESATIPAPTLFRTSSQITRTEGALDRAADIRAIITFTGSITVCTSKPERTRRLSETSGRTKCTGSGKISRTRSYRTWTPAGHTLARTQIHRRLPCTTTTLKTEAHTASPVMVMARVWSPFSSAETYTPNATMRKRKRSRTCHNQMAR